MQYMYIRRILNNTNLTFSSKSSWSTKINSLHVMATNFLFLITSPIYIRNAQIGKNFETNFWLFVKCEKCTSKQNWMILSYQKLIPLKLFYLIVYAISSWEIFTKKATKLKRLQKSEMKFLYLQKRAFISFLIWNYVDRDAFYHF